MKSDIISPNTGRYVGAGPMTATTQAAQAVAARKAQDKAVEDAKQEKYRSMLAELDAPWVKDSQNYHKLKKDYNTQLKDYYREHGRIDLTDPSLLEGYQQLKDYAVYSNQTKKYMEDVLSKVNPQTDDEIYFRQQMQKIQSIDNPFQRMEAIAEIESKGGFRREKYLDYGKTLEELEPEIKGLKMTEFEGTGMNNKRKTVIAKEYIAQQVKNRLQSENGMRSWIYALEGEIDVPAVNGYSYENQDGKEEFKPVNVDDFRKKYNQILNANTDENGQLTPEGQKIVDQFVAESNEEYVQAYAHNRAMEYEDQWNYQQYSGPSRYKKEDRPTGFFSVTGEIPITTAEGDFTAKNYGGPGMQKATYFPIANTMAEQLGAGDSDEAAVARYFTMYGTPDDTYVTLVFKQAEAADYEDAFARLNSSEKKLFEEASQKAGSRDVNDILDAMMQDKNLDNTRRSAIKQKLGLSGKAGVPRTFKYNQVKDIVESNPYLKGAIEEMWSKHTQELDAVPRSAQEGGGQNPPAQNGGGSNWRQRLQNVTPSWMKKAEAKQNNNSNIDSDI